MGQKEVLGSSESIGCMEALARGEGASSFRVQHVYLHTPTPPIACVASQAVGVAPLQR